jgi:GNAT superfamily N-acetyltransferase
MRFLETSEIEPLFRQHRPFVFGETFDFAVEQAYSEVEKAAIEALRARLGTPYRLNVAVYQGSELAGWSFGVQEGPARYYMINTGILPAHQGRGIYTALLPRILEILKDEGFQIIYSRHTATNSRVIVPKLKAGFVISGVEVSDVFGLLVHLSYFTNPLRRRMMDVRSGERIPDPELRKLLRLDGP